MNKENTPGYDPKIDYNIVLKNVRDAISSTYKTETAFIRDSPARNDAYRARCELGVVEDHVLRCLGIRGN